MSSSAGLTAKGLGMSLAALRRQDPYINNIVDLASQVALYTFNNQANEWEKTDVEGTLFVYSRLASPRHGFTIMNRLSMENLTEPITKDLDFQLQDPFLLYRNARFSIYGIWFYDKEDCQRIAELMKNLTTQEQLQAQQGSTVKPGVFPAGDDKGVDILQMLTKARQEYNKGKTSSEPKEIASSRVVQDNPNLIKPIPVKPVEQQPQDSEQKQKQLTLAALFGGASQTGMQSSQVGVGASNTGGARPAVARSLSYEEPKPCPAIQKLMTGQRGTELLKPLSESPENRLSENGPPPLAGQPRDPLQRLFPEPRLPCFQSELAQPLYYSPAKAQLTQVSPHDLLQRLQIVQQEQSAVPQPVRTMLAPRFQEPSSWADKVPPPQAHSAMEKANPLLQVISPQRIPATVAPTLLLSPMVFSQTKGSSDPIAPLPAASLQPPQVLTRSQLQGTLLHLIQNDATFLDAIYQSYISCRPKDTNMKKH